MEKAVPVAENAAWYRLSAEEVVSMQESSHNGLSVEESGRRLQEYGPNELKEGKRITPLDILLNQFKDFMILVLIVAAIISGFLGDIIDTIAIIAIVIINAIIGFVQEYRAEKAMQALKQMSAASAKVFRGGSVRQVPAHDIVPGDLVLIEAGDIIPADLRLIECGQLKVNEASLTGESVPVEKTTDAIPVEDLTLGDRLNMSYKGTYVTYGRGRGIVIATGMQTELGKIAQMLGGEAGKTPLQKRLTRFGKRLAVIILFICAIIFLIGWLRGEGILLMLLTAISLAVAAIPEALPSVITIALAIGAKRMVKQNALVRKLTAVETLGSVTYICTDKTGTLTENRMTVEQLYDGETLVAKDQLQMGALGEPIKDLLYAMSLNNDVIADHEENLKGDPTEIAIFEMAAQAGYLKAEVEKEAPRVADIPFDSDRKCMSTVHKRGNGYLVITKGAIDILLDRSANLSEAQRVRINETTELMAAEGLRTLGFAMKTLDALPEQIKPETIEIDLDVLGMVGMMDPPREEAKQAVSECKTAGIHPVMITGDHPLTAKSIARQLGILENDNERVITGAELNNYDYEEFKRIVLDTRVYARVSPEQKLNIVTALQDNHQFVAMTGDGVNDAPSLKKSDIGVAMGITGTDVTKEASDLILLDDNFATIVKAIRSGRRIYDNIRKFIKYAMTGNAGEIWSIFLAPFLGLPIPLLPLHILWINLVTDGLPGLALAVEPAERGIMRRAPRPPNESIFAQGLGVHILWVGLLIGLVTIGTQYLFIDNPKWQTMVFTVLCFSQMGHVFAIRSETRSFFQQGPFSNKPLLGAVLLTFVGQMAIIYLPVFQPVFKTQPLNWTELGITLALSMIVFLAVELEKVIKRALLKSHTTK
ncbi:MAG TPA: calcium-translocating P-type ATPase, PMCA-type [Chitinophagaceae bacterium]